MHIEPKKPEYCGPRSTIRSRRRTLLSAGLALAAAALTSPAAADRTRVEISPGNPGAGQPAHHRYTVWLDPAGEPHPLTPEEQATYCAAAEGFARNIWELTNGAHQIDSVGFDYSPTHVGEYDIHWSRFYDVAHANGLNSGSIDMFDEIVLCEHEFVNVGGQLVTQLKSSPCPTGLQCETGGIQYRERCLTSTGATFPVSPESAAEVLAHETSHAHYGIADEYVTNSSSSYYGFRVCENLSTDTSIMSTWHAKHWCDPNTHLWERDYAGFHIAEPSMQGKDNWMQAKKSWPNLANAYNAGSSYAAGDYVAHPVAPLTIPANFCSFGGANYDGRAVGDIMIVVDHSGSMNYQAEFVPTTSFEAAFAAGLEHYNATPAGRLAGVSAYNHENDRLIPYAARPAGTFLKRSDFTLSATGLTDICQAIDDAASQIRANVAGPATGMMLLLTDGLPTVSTCNTPAQVLDAARRACKPASANGVQVGVGTVAFGEADYNLMFQVSQMCGGLTRAIDHNSPTKPFEIQVAVSRAAFASRRNKEAMLSVGETYSEMEETVLVPPNTSALEVVWIGEDYEEGWSIPDSGYYSRCSFADLDHQLLDPSNNPAGTEIVSAGAESSYFTHTLRVENPAPGAWRMQTVAPSNWTCARDIRDSSEDSGYVPQLAMLAELQTRGVEGYVEVTPKIAAQNEPIVIRARLDVGSTTSLTGIDAGAWVQMGHNSVFVPLADDGVGDDKVAGDGLFSGTYNADCGMTQPQAAGGRRVVVALKSDATTAQSVIKPALDIPPTMPLAAPVTAQLIVEDSAYIQPCSDAVPVCPLAPQPTAETTCVEPSVVLDVPGGTISINAGETVCQIHANVSGMYLGTEGVSVGIAPHFSISQLVTSYNSFDKTTTLTFCATAGSDVPSGTYPISVQYGGSEATSGGTPFTVCNPFLASLQPQEVSSCDPGTEKVCVKPPTVSACAQGLTVRGRVSLEGQTRTLDLDASNCATLPLGTHSITWTASNGTQQLASTKQTVAVRSGVLAGSELLVRDRVKVLTANGRRAAIDNAGSVNTLVGSDAEVGPVLSRAAVDLRDRSHVYGDVTSAGKISTGNGCTYQALHPFTTPVGLVAPADLVVSFPGSPIKDVSLEPDKQASLTPGYYGKVSVKSRATLKLAAGTYFFDALDVLEPDAKLVVPAGDTVVIYVRSHWFYRGKIVDGRGVAASVTMGYLGTDPVYLEAPFYGRLLAPKAQVVVRGDYFGRLSANRIDIDAGRTVKCQ